MDAHKHPLGVCAWCGKDAYQTLRLRPGRRSSSGWRAAREVLVCPEHFHHFIAQSEIEPDESHGGGEW